MFDNLKNNRFSSNQLIQDAVVVAIHIRYPFAYQTNETDSKFTKISGFFFKKRFSWIIKCTFPTWITLCFLHRDNQEYWGTDKGVRYGGGQGNIQPCDCESINMFSFQLMTTISFSIIDIIFLHEFQFYFFKHPFHAGCIEGERAESESRERNTTFRASTEIRIPSKKITWL